MESHSLSRNDLESQDEFLIDDDMPMEPPTYSDVGVGSPEEEMLIEDIASVSDWYTDRVKHNSFLQILANIKDYFYEFFILPFRLSVLRPIRECYFFIRASYDFYIAKIGNPLILKRFGYVLVMSIFVYTIFRVTLDETKSGTKGSFSDHDELLHYAKRCVDLAKFEQDLEYLSSMHHNAGTKGDVAYVNYIEESLNKNGIKLIQKERLNTYLNYPTDKSKLYYYIEDETGGELGKHEIVLTKENFNPLSVNGDLTNKQFIYNNYGERRDYDELDNKGVQYEDSILLLKYSNLVSEQILLAQEKKVAGIVFMSNASFLTSKTDQEERGILEIDDYYKDLVQMIGVGLPQYGLGDPLSPGWSSALNSKISVDQSDLVPKIPTIPVSINQLEPIIQKLLKGDTDIKLDMHVEVESDDTHSTWNLLAKIEGKEQSDKAIVIGAARDSISFGASYPNFGTVTLMSLAQLFQQLKYKYGWKPLRNIYFMSYDSSMYNFEGSTEPVEHALASLKHEVYTYMDISQLLVEGNRIDIQTHPILHGFINKLSDKFNFRVKPRNVDQYGGWTPYMAKGFPVIVMSSTSNLANKLPKFSKGDNWEYIRNFLYKEYEDGDGWDRTSRLILYTLEIALKLADDPIIPFDFRTFVEVASASFQDLQKEVEELDSEHNSNLNFGSIQSSLTSWSIVVSEWEKIMKIYDQLVNQDGNNEEPSLISIHRWAWNRKLASIPLKQTFSDGIEKSRPFYKNIIFGPTLWSSKTHEWWSFPAIRDAVRSKNWDLAQKNINIVGEILQKTSLLFKEEDDTDAF